MSDQVHFDEDQLLIQRNMIVAQTVRNRLASVKNGDHLSANEVLQGVRLSHEEFLRLFDLAVEGYRAIHPETPSDFSPKNGKSDATSDL